MRIFHTAEDYATFQRVLAEGINRYSVELFTYCLMPNIGTWSCVPRQIANVLERRK